MQWKWSHAKLHPETEVTLFLEGNFQRDFHSQRLLINKSVASATFVDQQIWICNSFKLNGNSHQMLIQHRHVVRCVLLYYIELNHAKAALEKKLLSLWWSSARKQQLKNLPQLLAPRHSFWHLAIAFVISPQLTVDHYCIRKLSHIHSCTTSNFYLFFISKIQFVYIKNINFMFLWLVLISETYIFINHRQHGCTNVPHLIN